LSLATLADKLRITTVPPGAAVQINGVLVGTHTNKTFLAAIYTRPRLL
jgi:hypothetical protein